MNPLDVCITGLPRAGTTLTCTLLNRLPDAVALHEPMKANTFAKYGSLDALCDAIAQFFAQTRTAIETGNTIVAKRPGGKRIEKIIKRQLASPFNLCLKHPAAFTAILPGLARRFRCFAVIRNPLSVLGSWSRMKEMPVHNGHSPAAEKLSADLIARLAKFDDKIDRQIALLSWYFEQYQRWLPPGSIIRYEEMVATSGKCLNVIAPSAGRLEHALKSLNKKKRYGEETMRVLGERLLQSDGAHWAFYSKASVEALLQEQTPANA